MSARPLLVPLALSALAACATTPASRGSAATTAAMPARTAELQSFSGADLQSTGQVGDLAGALRRLDPIAR